MMSLSFLSPFGRSGSSVHTDTVTSGTSINHIVSQRRSSFASGPSGFFSRSSIAASALVRSASVEGPRLSCAMAGPTANNARRKKLKNFFCMAERYHAVLALTNPPMQRSLCFLRIISPDVANLSDFVTNRTAYSQMMVMMVRPIPANKAERGQTTSRRIHASESVDDCKRSTDPGYTEHDVGCSTGSACGDVSRKPATDGRLRDEAGIDAGWSAILGADRRSDSGRSSGRSWRALLW